MYGKKRHMKMAKGKKGGGSYAKKGQGKLDPERIFSCRAPGEKGGGKTKKY